MFQQIKRELIFAGEIHRNAISVRSQILSSLLFRVISPRLLQTMYFYFTKMNIKDVLQRSTSKDDKKTTLLNFKRLGVPDNWLPSSFYQTRCSLFEQPRGFKNNLTDRKSSSLALWCHSFPYLGIRCEGRCMCTSPQENAKWAWALAHRLIAIHTLTCIHPVQMPPCAAARCLFLAVSK